MTGVECPDRSRLMVNMFFNRGRLYLIQGINLPTTDDAASSPAAIRFSNSVSFFLRQTDRGILPTLSNKAWRAFLEIEQVLFAPQTAAIAAELPAFIYDAMARNDDRDAICSVGMPDGALPGL